MEPGREPTSAFFRDELSRALAECGFGISSWELEQASEGQGSVKPTANGKLWLLSDEAEVGPEIGIELSLQGYRVVDGLTPQMRTNHYETLDDLLCAVSPVFARRRTKLLFQKLEDVARERSWNDDEEVPSEQAS